MVVVLVLERVDVPVSLRPAESLSSEERHGGRGERGR